MAFWLKVNLSAMDVPLMYVYLPILTICIKDVGFEKDLKSKWRLSETTYFAPIGRRRNETKILKKYIAMFLNEIKFITNR